MWGDGEWAIIGVARLVIRLDSGRSIEDRGELPDFASDHKLASACGSELVGDFADHVVIAMQVSQFRDLAYVALHHLGGYAHVSAADKLRDVYEGNTLGHRYGLVVSRAGSLSFFALVFCGCCSGFVVTARLSTVVALLSELPGFS